MPRETSYTRELADEICTRLTEGESLVTICRDEHMPCIATIFNWLAKAKESQQFAEFLDKYTRAREAQGDYYAESTIEISDDGRNDWMERQSESEKGAGINTGWVLNGEHVQRSRLRVDTRKWYASKVAPKKYGDKITQEHSGTVQITGIETTIIDPKA